jgi:hypothetical protein
LQLGNGYDVRIVRVHHAIEVFELCFLDFDQSSFDCVAGVPRLLPCVWSGNACHGSCAALSAWCSATGSFTAVVANTPWHARSFSGGPGTLRRGE